MATVSKKELVDRVMGHVAGPNKASVNDIIQAFLDEMTTACAAGDRIELRDFGVFTPKERAARTARNPKTGVPIAVPATIAVTFKVGKEFKMKLNAATTAAKTA